MGKVMTKNLEWGQWVHEFDGGGGDRIATNQSEMIEGCFKVIKYHSRDHLRNREFGQLEITSKRTGGEGKHRLENDVAQFQFPIYDKGVHEMA